MKTYPALIIEADSGSWSAIVQGHGVPEYMLKRVEIEMIGEPDEDDGWYTEVEEVYLEWVPRLKWCSRHPLGSGFGCDQEGDWHGHWFAVRETAIEACHFTIIRHTDVEPLSSEGEST